MPQISGNRREFLSGVAALAAAGVASNTSVARAATAEKLAVVMDYLPTWKQAPFHLAVVKGWYRDAGLDVEVNDGSGSTVTITQAASGNCDLGLASLSAMAVARGKGADITAVARILRKNDIGMLVDRKLGIKAPNELGSRNAKIIFESTSFQSLFPTFFKNLGIDQNQVALMPMSPASAVGTYVAGQADALITTVPYVAAVVDEKRPSDAIMFADHGLPLPSHGLVAKPSILQQRGDAIRKFLAVTERAWGELWFGNPSEAIDALIAQRPQAKIDRALELRRVAAYRPFAVDASTATKGLLWMPPAEWEQAIAVMRDAGIVPATSKASDFFTDDYVPSP